jgi:type I restriction enzyme S subunit
MSFRRVKIESTYEGLYDGPHATPKPSDSGPVFLGIGNITSDGQLDLSDVRHIAEEDYAAWTKRVVPEPGDIVFTYEATLNRYAIIPQGFRGCLGRRLALIRPNSAKVNPRFLFLYFFGQDWRNTISGNILSGATVDRIPLTKFPEFEVNLPPRPVQDKIADILSAYDDLIENNTRRIKILEQMAQMLYREWFVNFRFPGHDKVKLAKSEVGEIPIGWELKRMDEVVEVIDCLHSKKPEHIADGSGLLLQLFNIGENGKLDISKRFLVSDSVYKLWTSRIEVRGGDCVITNVGRIAAVAQIPAGLRAALGRNMTGIRPRGITPTYLIEYLLSPYMAAEVSKKKDAGAIMDSLNVKGIVRLTVPMPPPELMQDFEQLSRPLRRQVEVLVQKNLNLRSTLDLLLPKLVSGEVSVEQIEQEVVAEMV